MMPSFLTPLEAVAAPLPPPASAPCRQLPGGVPPLRPSAATLRRSAAQESPHQTSSYWRRGKSANTWLLISGLYICVQPVASSSRELVIHKSDLAAKSD